MDKDDQNQPKMPLRNKGHEVELIQMPGQHSPTLGYQYGANNMGVEIRAQSELQWQATGHSGRQPEGDAAAISVETDQRTRTALYYEVPTEVRAKLNRMHSESVNQARKSENKPAGRISVKIGI